MHELESLAIFHDMANVDENPQSCIDEDGLCKEPCHPSSPCEACIEYWNRMKAEGYWVDGKGWTTKASKEWAK